MGLHKLTAGDGYLYLLRQVAASDGTDRGHTSLADYYTEKGESPGRWTGRGLASLARPVGRDPADPLVEKLWSVPAGSEVTEAQMKALFGEGLHPNADAITTHLSGVGLGKAGCHAAARLGRPFRTMANENAYLRRMRAAYALYNATLGQPSGAPIDPETKARIRTSVGREMFEEEHGRPPDNDRELTGFLARQSRTQTTAVAGYDTTFTPVKSFSALWALAPREIADTLLDCHHRAVADALVLIEQQACFARMGANGIAQVNTTGLIAAAFDHRDSRAGDPNPHTHVAISNKVQALGPDGIPRWLALDGVPLHRAAVAASELYNTQLEAYVGAELGLDFAAGQASPGKRPVREIVGVPEELMTLWSSRRAAITHRVGELAKAFQDQHHREPTAVEMIALSQQATLDTRQAKHSPRSLAEQRQTWRTEATEVLGDRSVEQLLSQVLAPARRRNPPSVTDAWIDEKASQVITAVSGKRAIWGVNHIRAETQRVLRYTGHQGDRALAGRIVAAALGAHSVALTNAADTDLGEPAVLRRADGASIYTPHDSTLYTSAAILAAERRILSAAGRYGGWVVDPASIDTALAEQFALHGVPLNDGQATLLRDMATSGARCQLAVAPAGTGKTTAAAPLASAWITSGGNVIGLAPTAAAAEVLAADLGAPTDTIAKLLHLAGVTGGPAAAPNDPARTWFDTIGPRTLIIVDEAGMASTADLDAVITHAMATGASVRLIGDDKQLASVAAGGVLRDIAENHGALALADVVRFTDPRTGAAEGAASLALREGDPAAIGFYVDHNRVHVGSEAAVIDMVYQAWADAVAAGRDALMCAPTNDLTAELNQLARLRRLAREPATSPRTVTLADGLQASVGDWIITRRNERWLRIPGGGWVKNGHRWIIRDIGEDGTITVSRLTGTKTSSVVRLPASYVTEDTTLGYARTINGAQGWTARHECHVVGTDALTREQLYVALTRGKTANHIYFSTSEADPHRVLAPKATHPPTAVDILTAILRRTDAHVSAHTTARQGADPAARIAAAADMYLDALTRGAETLAGPNVMTAIDAAAAHVRAGITDCEGWPVLRRNLALLHLDGYDPIAALQQAAAGSLDDAVDPAAVLDARLPQPAGSAISQLGPLPWLPSVPAALTADPQWGPYLARRAELASLLGEQIRQQIRSWTPGTAPGWARGLLAQDRIALMAEIGVFRAAHSVDAADSRITGAPQHSVRARTYQRLISDRLEESLRRENPGVTRWRTVADRIDPAIAADPFWPRLATHLDDAARAGLDVPGLLDDAITAHGRLPDELPAAALWWRLAGSLAPATLQRSNTRLRPPWTPELHRIFGSTIAETIVADPGWPTLVAAVGASDWPPAQLLDAAAERLLDLIADGADIRPDQYTRLLTYRVEGLAHDAARIDRDVPHAADDHAMTVDDDRLPPQPAAVLDEEPPPDPDDYAYGYTSDHDELIDFDALLTYRPTTAPPHQVDIPALRVRRDAARAHAAALHHAIQSPAGGPAAQAAGNDLAALVERHHAQRPYLADAAHAHADWLEAEAAAEAHHNMLTLLATLAAEADTTGETTLAEGYRDHRRHLEAITPTITTTLTAAAAAHQAARAALVAAAGGEDRIITDTDLATRRLAATAADIAALTTARAEARDLDNQLWRAETAAARAFAEMCTDTDLAPERDRELNPAVVLDASADVDVVEVVRREVELLEAAGGVSGAAAYPTPPEGYTAVPDTDRAAVAAIAAGAQSVQVLSLGPGADKTAALTAIAAAARHQKHRILALPATDTAAAHYHQHPYADGANTPQLAHDRFTTGQWTPPPGTLIVIDDAHQLTDDQLRRFTDTAAATNTKLLLVTTTDRTNRHSPADALAAHLPWTQHLGAPAPAPATTIDRVRRNTADRGTPSPGLADLLDRHQAITRTYTQRLTHRHNPTPDHHRDHSHGTER